MERERRVDVTNRVSIEIHPIESRHSRAEKSEFMKRATQAVVRVLRCSSEEVVVRIVEDKPENVSRAGTPFTRRK
jgi:phenylpyruvate tautomerase PptA (4-oxalocrotonate tautomerase family)